MSQNIETSWEAMMDVGTRTVTGIDAWYNQYTGFDGDAYVIAGHASDLGNCNLTVGDLTPSSGFTTSNNNQVIERLDVTGSINVAHKNVTIRGCRITSTTSADNGITGTKDGVTVEYCSLYGPASGTNADRAIWIEGGSDWVVRFNWLDGQHSSGFQVQGPGSNGALLEYNHVPGVRRYTDSHNTSTTFCATRGDLSTSRRNNLRDGTSAALSFYPQAWCGGAIDNVLVEENIFGIAIEGETWYYINSGGGGHDPITNTEISGNVFIPGTGPDSNPRQTMGDERGPATWFPSPTDGNVWADNEWLDGTTANI